MMWLLFAVLLVFASRADCGALRCAEGNCIPEEESKAPPIQLSRDELDPSLLPRDAECQAGSEWESNCHSCRCSEEGLAVCVKQPTCDKGFYAKPLRCKPNTTFEKDCNTCVCLPSGLGLCTLKGCRRHVKRSAELPSGKDCAPGTTWQSQCNQCFCSSTGTAMCTYRGCLSDEPLKFCASGSMWRNGDKICQCNSTGIGECNEIQNPVHTEGGHVTSKRETQTKLSRKVRAYQEPPKQCQPGEVFRLDCNKCLCDNEGQNFSCTRIDCNAVNKYPGGIDNIRAKRDTTAVEAVPCAAGSVFMRGCNVCRCSAEGRHAACTLKLCRDNELDARATGRARPRV